MKNTLKALSILTISAVAIFAVGYLFSLEASIQPQTIASPKATSTVDSAPYPDDVTVTGLIVSHGLTIPPTEVQFINTQTHEAYKAPINQTNHSYIISLPNNQTYGIEGDWNGRTFNATGIPMGAITMQCDNGSPTINLNSTNNAIVQNLKVGQ